MSTIPLPRRRLSATPPAPRSLVRTHTPMRTKLQIQSLVRAHADFPADTRSRWRQHSARTLQFPIFPRRTAVLPVSAHTSNRTHAISDVAPCVKNISQASRSVNENSCRLPDIKFARTAGRGLATMCTNVAGELTITASPQPRGADFRLDASEEALSSPLWGGGRRWGAVRQARRRENLPLDRPPLPTLSPQGGEGLATATIVVVT